MSFDTLQSKIIQKKAPIVFGLDARLEFIPPHILHKSWKDYTGEDINSTMHALKEFEFGLIDALYDIIPAVKPQAAYYEMLGWHGMMAMKEVMEHAKKMDMFVIADIKRGDIGTTATAYSQAWLGKVQIGNTEHRIFDADCVTINGYMGSDAIRPFLEVCQQEDKCAFTLVKTSNPSSSELQDLKSGDQYIYEIMADLTQNIAGDSTGLYGYNKHLGIVVGATHPDVLKELRTRLKHSFFLVPGYGAQGGTAADVQYAFDKNGHGAVINASRSIMCAWMKTGHNGEDYQEAARAAAEKMRDEIAQYVTIC